jgi:hypothetical protein
MLGGIGLGRPGRGDLDDGRCGEREDEDREQDVVAGPKQAEEVVAAQPEAAPVAMEQVAEPEIDARKGEEEGAERRHPREGRRRSGSPG